MAADLAGGRGRARGALFVSLPPAVNQAPPPVGLGNDLVPRKGGGVVPWRVLLSETFVMRAARRQPRE